MGSVGTVMLTIVLASLAFGALAWAAARLVERGMSGSRHTVWLWRAARFSVFAPLLGVAAATLIPSRSAPASNDAALTLPFDPLPFDAIQPVLTAAQTATDAAAEPIGLLLVLAYTLGLTAALVRAGARRAALTALMRTATEAPQSLKRRGAHWRERIGLRSDAAPIWVVDSELSPFVTGLKPIIVMPRALVLQPEADFALAHELMHVKRGDEADRMIGELLTAVFWFNPFAVWIERRLAGARELACDADLLDQLGPDQRKPYARALVGAAPSQSDARLQCAFLTDSDRLRVRRVKAILAHAHTSSGAQLAGVLAGATVLLAAAPAAASVWFATSEPRNPSATNSVASIRSDQTVSSELGQVVLTIQDAVDAEAYQSAIDQAGAALARTGLTAYDRSVLHRLSATARYNLDDNAGAIDAFEAAFATGALASSEAGAIQTNIGQLYLLLGDHDKGIDAFERAIEIGVEVTPRLAQTLAMAYATVGRFEEAAPYATQYYATLDQPRDNDAALMAYIYRELGRLDEAILHFERYFNGLSEPEERDLLTLVNLYLDAGRDADADRIWAEHDMAALARRAQEQGG